MMLFSGLINTTEGTPLVQQPVRPVVEAPDAMLLCRLGQETVQEICSRTSEVFHALKTLKLPTNSVSGVSAATDRKVKLQEQLRAVNILLRRLRIVYDKCCDSTSTSNLDFKLTYMSLDSLIPLTEEWDGRLDERKNTEPYRRAEIERNVLQQQVTALNQEIKIAIDLERRTLWEINTQLAMR